jgi:PPK2 family polyphosphate:nucleotide phosphotransferase
MYRTISLSEISTFPEKKLRKEKVLKKNEELIRKLSNIQNRLYAQKKYAVLIIIQGMDASGKDGAIKSVFSGVNPAGCNVKSFKEPTPEEEAHHFLWRVNKECPAKGMMMIFNRSHYEEILEPAVKNEKSDKLIKERCEEINAFEKGLSNDNTIIFKFYLHVSHSEQLKRLKERKTDEHKRWKYQKKDISAIAKHKEYKEIYESIFRHCSDIVPWHIIPSDKNWYKNYCILNILVDKLEKYDIKYPVISL